jgi:hypothetical protein
MKKNILAILFSFITLCAFTQRFDFRQVLFSNNYENIEEVTDKNLLNTIFSAVQVFDRHGYELVVEEGRVFCESYKNGRLYRYIGTSEYDNKLSTLQLSDVKSINSVLVQYVFFQDENSQNLVNLSGDFICENKKENDRNKWICHNVEVIKSKDLILGIMVCESESLEGSSNEIYEDPGVGSEARYFLWKNLINTSLYDYGENSAGELSDHYFDIQAGAPLIDPDRPFMYTIQNAFDNNPATSFVENTEDDKFGISVSDMTSFNSIKCTKLSIINGYAKNIKLYKDNNRIRKVSLRENNDDEKKEVYIGLNDNTLTPQIVNWPETAFYVTELYDGDMYSDTCLAELDFFVDGKWLFK